MEKALLYIDDEIENLNVFQFSFHKYFTIYTAENVNAGMEILEKKSVQIVISDQRMPGKSGILFFEELSVTHPNIIRILLTAFSDYDAVIDAINRGKVYHYLNKPFDLHSFKNILDKAFETHQLRIHNSELIEEVQNNNNHLINTLKISELNENKFRNIFNTSLDGIVIFSDRGYVLEANNIWIERSGYTIEELQGMQFFQFIPEQYRDEIFKRFKRVVNGENLELFEFEVHSKSGQSLFIEINSHLIDYSGNKAVLSIIRDTSERKKMQMDLMKITISVEEKERKKLSSDLHDEVGPLLSSMNMMLSSLSNKAELNKYQEILGDIISILKETIATVREISYNISPHILNYYGLTAAIKNFFETKSELIKVDFITNMEGIRFTESIEIMLYRIVKEVFNNTLKYAEATNIKLKIQHENEIINLHYSDNGKGFDLYDLKSQSGKGMGMLSIINRISSIGGNYSINTFPGGGFALDIKINIAKI